MKWIIRTLMGLLSVIIILVLISFFLKDHYKVTREKEMKVSAEKVYALVSDFQQWKSWSPWYRLDTSTKYEYTGQIDQPGYTMTWDSKNENVGKGKLSLIKAETGRKLLYELTFDDWEMKSNSSFEFKPTANGVLVSWTDEGDLGWNPISRWFGLFMDKMMGKDFENGLENLDKAASVQP